MTIFRFCGIIIIEGSRRINARVDEPVRLTYGSRTGVPLFTLTCHVTQEEHNRGALAPRIFLYKKRLPEGSLKNIIDAGRETVNFWGVIGV